MERDRQRRDSGTRRDGGKPRCSWKDRRRGAGGTGAAEGRRNAARGAAGAQPGEKPGHRGTHREGGKEQAELGQDAAGQRANEAEGVQGPEPGGDAAAEPRIGAIPGEAARIQAVRAALRLAASLAPFKQYLPLEGLGKRLALRLSCSDLLLLISPPLQNHDIVALSTETFIQELKPRGNSNL
ncbi:splicing factor, arginine/serine-rich 19-like [Cuculus canorus]|uniref:splicing factor, arginine/serine-rich 19-like n=1 Tax=Cuculus canorus TaxID=55661 RepID=UPI0023AAD997|nr:splicing factor, arginine/serine-rich 19-like [Cuculus canorus]